MEQPVDPSQHDREAVRQRYADAARSASAGAGWPPVELGGDACPGFGVELYDDADRTSLPVGAVTASLGCGTPLAAVEVRPGDALLDLGSGAGLDLLLSAREVGETGLVYGLDMTDEMIELASANVARAGATNVELLKGYIEDIPLPDASIDVVISNCVVNLSVDKQAVFSEVSRILREGGRIGITDIVADDSLSVPQRQARAASIGCLNDVLTQNEYQELLSGAALRDATIEVTHEVAPGLHSAIIRAIKPSRDQVEITDMYEDDWPDVADIYLQGIATGNATLETSVPDWDHWDRTHLDDIRLVARRGDDTVGWAALSPVSDRCVYEGVAEVSVYVAEAARGSGVGRQLLGALVERSEAAGIWTLEARTFPENAASLALHRGCGFRVVGTRERIGRLGGKWRDIVLLERRSAGPVGQPVDSEDADRK